MSRLCFAPILIIMPNLSVIQYDWNFFDSSQCQVSDCWCVSKARSASSDGGEDPRSDRRLRFVVVTDVELHGAVVPLKIDVTDDGCGVLILRLPVDLYLLVGNIFPKLGKELRYFAGMTGSWDSGHGWGRQAT